MKAAVIALVWLVALGSGAFLWIMAAANEALIRQLAGDYAARIYRENKMVAAWLRLGPIKVAELLIVTPPKEVEGLARPLRYAAIIHATSTALALLLLLIAW